MNRGHNQGDQGHHSTAVNRAVEQTRRECWPVLRGLPISWTQDHFGGYISMGSLTQDPFPKLSRSNGQVLGLPLGTGTSFIIMWDLKLLTCDPLVFKASGQL